MERSRLRALAILLLLAAGVALALSGAAWLAGRAVDVKPASFSSELEKLHAIRRDAIRRANRKPVDGREAMRRERPDAGKPPVVEPPSPAEEPQKPPQP
jgi:hypothetical protein